ncbi:hypothetical protein HY572_02205 [Candidatus Micrarchaeota archaeon]|nr:hypothetical protein [Candidatus Micrarchaeota archaeon]
MKRGQAFETMMLVISVIVAIAILGVLLNILGGVSFGVGDPKEIMKTELKSINSAGYGFSQPKEAEFKTGSYIDQRSVIGDAPILANQLAFGCESGNTVCGSGKDAAIEVTDKDITVNKNTKAFIVVCGDESKDTPNYCVGVGRQPSDSRDACRDACNIQ